MTQHFKIPFASPEGEPTGPKYGDPGAAAIGAQQDSLWALAYPAAYQAYDIAGQTVGADELFEAARRPLDRSFTQMQEQNMEWLNAAGILSGGTAGVYGENTPFQQTNRSYMDTLAGLSGWAAIEAPQMALRNLGQAMNMGMGLQTERQRQYQGLADQTYQIQLNEAAARRADDAADAARWEGYGQMFGDAYGLAGEAALTYYTLGMFGGGSGSFDPFSGGGYTF